jgi:exoribonuclease R
MPVEPPITTAAAPPPAIEQAFDAARETLGIRTGFPPEVVAEAERAAAEVDHIAADPRRADRTAIPLVTIDPPGSRDLDQALHIERRGRGHRVHYAIADVGAFVARGGAIEREAWKRGVTYYAPDEREPLYPPVLSEGAASLLPNAERPAILFTLDTGAKGELEGFAVESARVRSRAQLTYGSVLRRLRKLDGGSGSGDENGDAPAHEWTETLVLLREVGRLRIEREIARGGISLPIRDQHVQRRAAARLGYELVYEEPNEAEQWNAQISLLTGHAAALRMLDAGVGLLRTLAPPTERDLRRFRLTARALGFRWPRGESYAEFMHRLDPDAPRAAALVWQAKSVMRGAGYLAFSGECPAHPAHGALAMAYSHCTAPLRRLADCYVLDLLLTLAGGAEPAPAAVETLAALPEVMAGAARRANALERTAVDIAEVWALRGREGERFDAVVLDVERQRIEVQIEEPPVRTTVPLGDATPPALGERVEVRLVGADAPAGQARFELVE